MPEFTLPIPVIIEENYCYMPWEDPDGYDDPDQRLMYCSPYMASLKCGCTYVGDRTYGYGQTPEEAFADLTRRIQLQR